MSHTRSPAMLIVFTVLQQGQQQTLSMPVATLEEGLDWLNALITTGQKLVSIHLVDEHSTIRLPLQAFDGQPMSDTLQALERQWQDLLRPAKRTTKRALERAHWIQSRIEMTRQRLQLSERKIDTINRSIYYLQTLLDRSLAQPGGVTLSHHYDTVLTRYRLTLQRYRQQRLMLLTQLGQLRQQLTQLGPNLSA